MSNIRTEVYEKIKRDLFLSTDEEVDEVFDAVSTALLMVSEDLSENEPYAVNDIREYQNASDKVQDLIALEDF